MGVFIAGYTFIMFVVACASVHEYIIEPHRVRARIRREK